MLLEVIEDNGVKKLRPLAGNYVNNDEKVPVGVINAYWGTTPPENWLVCNGATFDTTAYPELYVLLGSNKLPDLRESTLVGAGERTSGVTEHDVYSIGQFKDDQVGVHTHCYWHAHGDDTNALLGYIDGTQVDVYKAVSSSPIQHTTWRWGFDHGWVYGVLNNIDPRSTWDAGAHSGRITTRSAWDGSVIPAQFYGDGVFSANNGWGSPNARTSYDSSWNEDARCSTITLSVGDHLHYYDHRHILPYVGTNTEAGNPNNRSRANGERNGSVTRTKQTGVAFIIKAK